MLRPFSEDFIGIAERTLDRLHDLIWIDDWSSLANIITIKLLHCCSSCFYASWDAKSPEMSTAHEGPKLRHQRGRSSFRSCGELFPALLLAPRKRVLMEKVW